MKTFLIAAMILVAGSVLATSSPFPPYITKFTGDMTINAKGVTDVSSITDDLVISGTTPVLTIGDAGAEDSALVYDGAAQDFHLGLDDSSDKLVIGLGSVLGTTERLTFNSADLNIIVGDATAADVGFIFDGAAQDYNISMDDSTDDLVIGLDSAAGTTDALRIDENQDVTFVQDILPLSTITGDGGAALSGMLQKQVTSTAGVTLTIAQCGSSVVTGGAHTIVLPEASTALGCRYTFIGATADTLTINPADGTDVIGAINYVAAGTSASIAPSAGDAVSFTDLGASLVLEATNADLWAQVGLGNLTMTDAN